jgi:hypothetical protein
MKVALINCIMSATSCRICPTNESADPPKSSSPRHHNPKIAINIFTTVRTSKYQLSNGPYDGRFRRLVAGASPRKRGFDSRPADMHFVVDIAPSSSRFFSRYRSISISYTYFIRLARRHIILGIDSVVK